MERVDKTQNSVTGPGKSGRRPDHKDPKSALENILLSMRVMCEVSFFFLTHACQSYSLTISHLSVINIFKHEEFFVQLVSFCSQSGEQILTEEQVAGKFNPTQKDRH